MFWNNAAVTDVDIGTPQTVDRIVFRSQAGTEIDYFLFAGRDVDQIIGAYRQLTGQVPLMARWTWGLWQSKERYKTQEELLGVAAQYRKLGIPLDAVVQDWQYWRPGEWGGHRMDPTRFPAPKEMLDTLHSRTSIVSSRSGHASIWAPILRQRLSKSAGFILRPIPTFIRQDRAAGTTHSRPKRVVFIGATYPRASALPDSTAIGSTGAKPNWAGCGERCAMRRPKRALVQSFTMPIR